MKAQPLSQGQQQLLCLAQVILKKDGEIAMREARGSGGVLILDEATSSIDLGTEREIQKVFKKEFQGWTVVTVAHRMETIRGSDVVAVLDGGKLVEFGTPAELIGKGGIFKVLSRG